MTTSLIAFKSNIVTDNSLHLQLKAFLLSHQFILGQIESPQDSRALYYCFHIKDPSDLLLLVSDLISHIPAQINISVLVCPIEPRYIVLFEVFRPYVHHISLPSAWSTGVTIKFHYLILRFTQNGLVVIEQKRVPVKTAGRYKIIRLSCPMPRLRLQTTTINGIMKRRYKRAI